MIDLIGKRIIPEELETLYAKPFTTESLASDFDVRGGEWSVQDGWLTGKSPNGSGIIISRSEYKADVLLEFRARTVLPSSHDIDVLWNASWDFDKNKCSTAYILGIEGWHDGKVGIEKPPDYLLKAATKLFLFEPGRIYTVQCGSVKGHVFCVIDGALAIEMTDPSPIDVLKHGRFGFEAYAGHIQFTGFKLKRAVFTPITKQYAPEF